MSVFKLSFKCPRTGKRKQSQCYYGKAADVDGTVKRHKLAETRRASEDKLADLKYQAKLARSAKDNPIEAAARRPLTEHVIDFRRYLESKRGTKGHVAGSISRLVKLLDGCGFRLIGDVSPQPVRDWLKAQLDRGCIDPLPGTVDDRPRPFGLGAANHYLTAAKSFCRWAYNDHRLARNPLAGIAKFNEQEDRRLSRRAMLAEELEWLVSTTKAGKGDRKTLPGTDRAMIYQIAAFTGLRANEVASLSPASFDLEAAKPFLVIESTISKRRRQDVLPIADGLAASLREYLASRDLLPIERQARLWPGKWYRRAAEILRDDMAQARVAWIEAAPDFQRDEREQSDFLLPEDASGDVLDFHALRHTFCTNLAASNASPKLLMELARHSTPALTLGRYAHVRLSDAHNAVNALPRLGDPRQPERLRATGTDGRAAQEGPENRPQPTRPKLDQSTADSVEKTASRCTATRPRQKRESPQLSTNAREQTGENAEEDGQACPPKSSKVNSRGGARTRTGIYSPQDFKSCASANFATRPIVNPVGFGSHSRIYAGPSGVVPSGVHGIIVATAFRSDNCRCVAFFALLNVYLTTRRLRIVRDPLFFADYWHTILFALTGTCAVSRID
jgi:integrase